MTTPDFDQPFNFAQYLMDVNKDRPEKIAYIDDRTSISYHDLFSRVRRLASALTAHGIRREDRVLLLMQDCIDWPTSFLATLYTGIIPVAVNTLLTADDYAYMLEHSHSRAVLVSGNLLSTLNAAMSRADHDVENVIVSRPETALQHSEHDFDALISAHPECATAARTSADEPAFWLYSSGSTGRPKGTVHRHANPYWTARYYGQGVLDINEQDVCFSAAKLFFAYGLGNALSFPMSVGATTILMPERPTPDAVFARLCGEFGERKPTLFFGAPTGLLGMLESPSLPSRDAVDLRLMSSAGEALPADLGERINAHFGVDVIDGIGSTEMLHIFLSNRPGAVRYGTTGIPVDGYAIELRSEDGQAVPDGEPGDLYISGPSSALMYWANVDKSRDTFRGPWVKSGDKYIRNSDGTFTYAGRTDDMLKVSGIYVSPFEVEATVMMHPSVLEAAVVGVTDDTGLMRVKAYVVLKQGKTLSSDALKDFVKERLAPYKYPRLIEFIDELPKTATGKIQRFRLRDRPA